MSRVFVDTSAIFALLVPSDRAHGRAKRAFAGLQARDAPLMTSSYVLVETYALLGRRLGLGAVRAFREGFLPLLEVRWVDAELHEKGLDVLLDHASERLSLVDAVSSLVVREARILEVFAYDRHFEQEGLSLVC